MIKLYKNLERNIGRGVVVRSGVKSHPVKVWIIAVKDILRKSGHHISIMVSSSLKRYTWGEIELDQAWDNYHEFMREEVKRLENSEKELRGRIEELERKNSLFLLGNAKNESLNHQRELLQKISNRLTHWSILLKRTDEIQCKRHERRKNIRENKEVIGFLKNMGFLKTAEILNREKK